VFVGVLDDDLNLIPKNEILSKDNHIFNTQNAHVFNKLHLLLTFKDKDKQNYNFAFRFVWV